MKCFIDSSIIIEHLKGNKSATEILTMLIDNDIQSYISLSVVEEIIYISKKKKIKGLKKIFDLFEEFFIILELEKDIYNLFKEFVLKYHKVNSADILHLATCKYYYLNYLISFDNDFKEICKKEGISFINSKVILDTKFKESIEGVAG